MTILIRRLSVLTGHVPKRVENRPQHRPVRLSRQPKQFARAPLHLCVACPPRICRVVIARLGKHAYEEVD